MDGTKLSTTEVIPWGCPVPSFGDLANSRVATLGLNPSNREFIGELGEELEGDARRFHTLNSLGISSWSEADARHLQLILDSCRTYFAGNPYDKWFRKLDQVVSGTNTSFYDSSCSACHLDLIPYATIRKWTDLDSGQRSLLLSIAADILGLLLRDSPVRILILNGQSVVDRFQEICGIRLKRQEMPTWSLNRRGKPAVRGVSYLGTVRAISEIDLHHEILVLGYNHNLQSSFGVTTAVIQSIRDWIIETLTEQNYETARQ
ncbi:MAG: hypothetical protein JST79_20640 [Acidobacteria bacterium]|nr:hypothetical protein [Acidobacteriota bacterium]